MTTEYLIFEYDVVTKLRTTPHVVQVYLYNDGTASCWPYLSKNAKDQIEWISTGPEFTIHFNHSPFVEKVFKVPAGGRKRSGPAVSEATTNVNELDTRGDYVYTVEAVALGMAADPGLSVTP